MKTNLAMPFIAMMGCSTLFGAETEVPLPSPLPLSAPAHPPTDGPPAAHVVVIAIDGVRAHEVFLGIDASRSSRTERTLTPHLRALAGRGMTLGHPEGGAPFRASGPNYVSLPGYTEILSGRPAACQENDCDQRGTTTLLDGFLEAGGGPVAIVSSWHRLGAFIGPRHDGALVSTGRHNTRGFEPYLGEPRLADSLARGELVDPSPGWGEYRPDERTIEVALETMRAARPRFLFVSLGDTDEHAHAGNYDGYVRALEAADRFVGAVDSIAREWDGEGEPTAVFVTTDHGRSHDFAHHGREHPESSATWLIAAGAHIPPLGELSGSPRTLSDLAPLIASIAAVPSPSSSDEARLATDIRRASRTAVSRERSPSSRRSASRR